MLSGDSRAIPDACRNAGNCPITETAASAS